MTLQSRQGSSVIARHDTLEGHTSMSCRFIAVDGGGRFALASAIRSSSSVGWLASNGIVAGSTGPMRAFLGRCCSVFGGWTGAKALLKISLISASAACQSMYIRRILPRTLQDDCGTPWMPCEHGGRVVDLSIDNDPAAVPGIVLLDFLV